MTKIPTYEQLLIELHCTLEALIQYSSSPDVKRTAKIRLDLINKVRKQGDGFFIAVNVKADQNKGNEQTGQQ